MDSLGLPQRLQRADETVFLFLYLRTRNPIFDLLMPVLSRAANRGFLYFVAAAVMLAVDRKFYLEAAAAMLAGVGLAGLLAEWTIKLFWKRKRPFVAIEGVTARLPAGRFMRRPSFPSGHSAGYFAAAAALATHFPHLAPVFYGIAALGAFSRTYCGVHFFSDVLVGSAIGVAAGQAAFLLTHHFLG